MAAAALGSYGLSKVLAAGSGKKPNLIFILSDQQHYHAVGAIDPWFETPNMDQFLSQSTLIERMYCPTPLCSPARSTLLTGRQPWKNGVYTNGIHLNEETIAVRLQKAGYYTAYFGKWHLGDKPVATSGWNEKQGVYNEYAKPNHPLSAEETEGYALDFISRAGKLDKPFALFVSYDQPHGVYWAMPNSAYPRNFMPEPKIPDNMQFPASWSEKSLPPGPPWDNYPDKGTHAYWMMVRDNPEAAKRYRAIYRECVRSYDERLGTVLNALRKNRLFDESLIMLSSDHGDMDTAHSLVFKGPVPFEELQHVPLAVKLPGQTTARREKEALAASSDLPSTLLDYAGDSGGTEAGFSLRPLLEGHGKYPRTFAAIQCADPLTRSVVQGNYKYTRFKDGNEWLFNLSTDPGEMHNLIHETAEKKTVERMRVVLEEAFK